jgi:hypothetical protein
MGPEVDFPSAAWLNISDPLPSRVTRGTILRPMITTTKASPSGLRVLLGCAVLLLTSGILSACGAVREPDSIPAATVVQASTPSPTAVVTYVPTYIVYAQQVEATAMAIAAILPTASPIAGMAPEKAADLQENDLLDRAVKTAVALHPPPSNYEHPVPTTEVSLVPGPTLPVPPHRATANGTLFEGGAPGDPTCSRISTVNDWVGQVGGTELHVCAGHVRKRSEQGVLIVIQEYRQTNYYETTVQAGALQIMEEIGGQLNLRAANGTGFQFDLAMRQWVTPTPGPSPSPGPSPLPTTTP